MKKLTLILDKGDVLSARKRCVRFYALPFAICLPTYSFSYRTTFSTYDFRSIHTWENIFGYGDLVPRCSSNPSLHCFACGVLEEWVKPHGFPFMGCLELPGLLTCYQLLQRSRLWILRANFLTSTLFAFTYSRCPMVLRWCIATLGYISLEIGLLAKVSSFITLAQTWTLQTPSLRALVKPSWTFSDHRCWAQSQ